MGLDMYLEARKYVSKIDWKAVPQGGLPDGASFDDYESEDFVALKGLFPARLLKHNDAGSSVAINIGYWRKANQIHGWFVREVQDNQDDCREYPVSSEKLAELLDTVRKVLDGNKDTARELLPVTAGFFFGNYNEDDGYDEYYYEQLRYTETMLEDILNALSEEDKNTYDLYYQSSW
jgi:hypothetical protein